MKNKPEVKQEHTKFRSGKWTLTTWSAGKTIVLNHDGPEHPQINDLNHITALFTAAKQWQAEHGEKQMRQPDKFLQKSAIWQVGEIGVQVDREKSPTKVTLEIEVIDAYRDLYKNLTLDAARELRDCLDAAITWAEGKPQ
ncbi:hypothetical protein OS125_11475 [Corynebacterium sp. P7003]|uniref:Phage protein n=1 Tax=Corynebacterium pygosceleis TaxID=2800406 RepID=A0ABT3WUK9_9CORY|nr:hypothetical protein [Corynebacterium pygosceleis]MCX7445851.1 hypothetical protein [Corynebacterium pygosceleis]